MLRSAVSAFTRVFDALWLAAWCAADPGSIGTAPLWVPAPRRTAGERCAASGTRVFLFFAELFRSAQIRPLCGCLAECLPIGSARIRFALFPVLPPIKPAC